MLLLVTIMIKQHMYENENWFGNRELKDIYYDLYMKCSWQFLSAC